MCFCKPRLALSRLPADGQLPSPDQLWTFVLCSLSDRLLETWVLVGCNQLPSLQTEGQCALSSIQRESIRPSVKGSPRGNHGLQQALFWSPAQSQYSNRQTRHQTPYQWSRTICVIHLFSCSYWCEAWAPWVDSCGCFSLGWYCAVWGLWCPSLPLLWSPSLRQQIHWKQTPPSVDCWGSWMTWWWSSCSSSVSSTSINK